jgi:hypothetical protein
MSQYYSPKERAIIEHLKAVYQKIWDTLGRFEGSYIAGGSIASLVLGETPNDYDVWFESIADYDAAVVLIKAKQDDFGEGPVTIIAETEHAITFRLAGLDPVLQFVKSRVGAYDEVVEQFDFQHAQACFLPEDQTEGLESELIFLGSNSIDFIEEKILVFAGVLDYPTHTFSRIAKFAKRGFKVPDQTLIKMIRAVRDASAELIEKDALAVIAKYHGLQYAEESTEEYKEEHNGDEDACYGDEETAQV